MKYIRPFAPPTLLVFATAASIFTHGINARACSAPACQAGDLFPTAGNVPQNALAWFLRHSTNSFDNADAGAASDDLRVFVVPSDDSEQAEVEVELTPGKNPPSNTYNGADELWLPATDIAVGTTLRVESSSECGQNVHSSYITVEDAAETPTTLGTLKVTTKFDTLDIWTASGGCTEPVRSAYADVTIALSASAAPFADVLRYSLLVDGEPYRNTDWIWTDDDGVVLDTIAGSALGAGKERAFATCATYEELMYGNDEGVEPTQHDVQMMALLPDGTSLMSDVVSIDLTCPCGDWDGSVNCTESPSNDDLAVSSRTSQRQSGCAVVTNTAPSPSAWLCGAGLLCALFCVRGSSRRRLVTRAVEVT